MSEESRTPKENLPEYQQFAISKPTSSACARQLGNTKCQSQHCTLGKKGCDIDRVTRRRIQTLSERSRCGVLRLCVSPERKKQSK